MADTLNKIRLSAGEAGREAYGTQQNNMKTAPANGRAVDLTEAQPWEMALMGQLSAQEPQSRQAPALIS